MNNEKHQEKVERESTEEFCKRLGIMINVARRTIVLADASKPGHSAFAQIAPLERIDTLVTDEQPPWDLAQALKEARVELIVAPEE